MWRGKDKKVKKEKEEKKREIHEKMKEDRSANQKDHDEFLERQISLEGGFNIGMYDDDRVDAPEDVPEEDEDVPEEEDAPDDQVEAAEDVAIVHVAADVNGNVGHETEDNEVLHEGDTSDDDA